VNGKEAQKHGDCLSDEVLTNYLEGTLDSVTRTACESHLITCDPCRQNLALYMKVLRDDVNPEEDAAVQELATLWEQRNPRPIPIQRPRPSVRWIYAVAAAAVILVAVLIGRPWSSEPEISKTAQLNEALLQKDRPFVPRVVGQRYVPLQEFTRSSEDVTVEGVLEKEMTSQSAESYEVGRYFLLQRKYPKAIKYLSAAVADPKGVPADVHNDLGVAYLESKDLKAAETEFKDALSRNSSHLPALFNISLLYLREGRVDDAKQWAQRYLVNDPDSQWATELQKRLSGKESAER
jgi:tetratricopeptide (TPR) repeat protein